MWVRGDHDIATAPQLRDELRHIIELDDADVVVDLSCVTFMDATTIDVLLSARTGMRAPWTFDVRDPSPFATRVIALCGFSQPASFCVGA